MVNHAFCFHRLPHQSLSILSALRAEDRVGPWVKIVIRPFLKVRAHDEVKAAIQAFDFVLVVHIDFIFRVTEFRRLA